MTTVETARRSPAARRMRAFTQLSAVALTSALALTGCATAGHPGGYIDMYFDNGDPIYSPHKAELFDEQGEALCNTPIYLGRLESRTRPFSDTGGLLNSFLWELSNPNIDPDTPNLEVPSGTTDKEYRELLRRRQGGLERMYELTHPHFDEVNGVSGPDDMEAIRVELATLFPAIANSEAPAARFITPGSSWIETDKGRFDTRRPGDVELYMETIGVTGVEFNGLENDYYAASGEAGEFLIEINRESGEFRFVGAGGEFEVEHMEFFQQLGIMQTFGQTESVAVVMTVVNDGCPAAGGQQASRWWIYEIQEVEPAAPVQDEEEATEEAAETEASE